MTFQTLIKDISKRISESLDEIENFESEPEQEKILDDIHIQLEMLSTELYDIEKTF
jgi:hypothetical protein